MAQKRDKLLTAQAGHINDVFFFNDAAAPGIYPLSRHDALPISTVLKASKNGFERGGAHLLGTCRMGDDPERSVTDPFGQVYGYPGLYCSDSSTIPGSTGVNPALTIAANAERIAAHLVETN